jgi:hypothetical protein
MCIQFHTSSKRKKKPKVKWILKKSERTWEVKKKISQENRRVLKVRTSISICGWRVREMKLQKYENKVKFNWEKEKNN